MPPASCPICVTTDAAEKRAIPRASDELPVQYCAFFPMHRKQIDDNRATPSPVAPPTCPDRLASDAAITTRYLWLEAKKILSSIPSGADTENPSFGNLPSEPTAAAVTAAALLVRLQKGDRAAAHQNRKSARVSDSMSVIRISKSAVRSPSTSPLTKRLDPASTVQTEFAAAAVPE